MLQKLENKWYSSLRRRSLLFLVLEIAIQSWFLIFPTSEKAVPGICERTELSYLCFLSIHQADGMLLNVISMENTHSSPYSRADTAEFQGIGLWRGGH